MCALLRLACSCVIGLAVWLPLAHCVFEPSNVAVRGKDGANGTQARALAAGLMEEWGSKEKREAALERMATSNPEWGFMERTFLVLAFSNMAQREPARQTEFLSVIDAIIVDTLRREKAGGAEQYLMRYGRGGGWIVPPGRSAMVDGEVALMLGLRRMVAERAEYAAPMRERLEITQRRMERSPVLCAESYPDECWLFCNSVTLAAMRLEDVLDHTNHGAFFQRWLAVAREKLREPTTGLLIATWHVDGRPAPAGPGPEGTSAWLSNHMLDIVDPAFAADQHMRARRALGRDLLGFGYSREWAVGLESAEDVDSGPVLPWLGASGPASGLAMISAAGFHDETFQRRLLATLELGACPERTGDTLRYRASNPVGDAVLLYSLTLGPMWEKVRTAGKGEVK